MATVSIPHNITVLTTCKYLCIISITYCSTQIQLICTYTKYLFDLTGFLAVTRHPKSDTRLCNAYNVTGYIYQQYHLSILSHQIF